MTIPEATAKINALFAPSDGQRRVLVRAGYTDAEVDLMKKWQASKCIEACKAHGWKRPVDVTTAEIQGAA